MRVGLQLIRVLALLPVPVVRVDVALRLLHHEIEPPVAIQIRDRHLVELVGALQPDRPVRCLLHDGGGRRRGVGSAVVRPRDGVAPVSPRRRGVEIVGRLPERARIDRRTGAAVRSHPADVKRRRRAVGAEQAPAHVDARALADGDNAAIEILGDALHGVTLHGRLAGRAFRAAQAGGRRDGDQERGPLHGIAAVEVRSRRRSFREARRMAPRPPPPQGPSGANSGRGGLRPRLRAGRSGVVRLAQTLHRGTVTRLDVTLGGESAFALEPGIARAVGPVADLASRQFGRAVLHDRAVETGFRPFPSAAHAVELHVATKAMNRPGATRIQIIHTGRSPPGVGWLAGELQSVAVVEIRHGVRKGPPSRGSEAKERRLVDAPGLEPGTPSV